jgi:hypothetical protein
MTNEDDAMDIDGTSAETPGRGNNSAIDGPTDTTAPEPRARSKASRKTLKCAYCRKDHKGVSSSRCHDCLHLLTTQCFRVDDSTKCDRCRKLGYPCFGGLDTAFLTSPKRMLQKNKCSQCREARVKVGILISTF